VAACASGCGVCTEWRAACVRNFGNKSQMNAASHPWRLQSLSTILWKPSHSTILPYAPSQVSVMTSTRNTWWHTTAGWMGIHNSVNHWLSSFKPSVNPSFCGIRIHTSLFSLWLLSTSPSTVYFFVKCLGGVCIIRTNKIHFFLIIYFNNHPLHVSNRLTIYHREEVYCTCNIC
jgi:hypothetical protein